MFVHKKCLRTIRRFFWILWVALIVSGCSSFSREWKAAPPSSPAGLVGRWEGRWVSESTGHEGPLRCIITQVGTNRHQARFQARYAKILKFTYTASLEAQSPGPKYEFRGTASLPGWAGGIYHYDGYASSNNFYSTYRSKNDEGYFKMLRLEERNRDGRISE